MERRIFFVLVALFSPFLFVCCKKQNPVPAIPVIIQSGGDIQTSADQFRNLLGNLNTTTGAISGRREVNWDGVPDSLIGTALPADFFNPVAAAAPMARKRGLTYIAGAGEFRVSDNGFADINPAAAPQFNPFSGNKTFTNISSNLWQVKFQVAGQNTAAGVKGFGAVFSDVDQENSTSMEFFNEDRSLGKYFVPAKNSIAGFSFLGVYFSNGETITRVMVSHQGKLASGEADVSNGGTKDLIVLDDFIYSEPLAQ